MLTDSWLQNANIKISVFRPGMFVPARPEANVNPPVGEAIFASQLVDAVIEDILDIKK